MHFHALLCMLYEYICTYYCTMPLDAERGSHFLHRFYPIRKASCYWATNCLALGTYSMRDICVLLQSTTAVYATLVHNYRYLKMQTN